MSSLLLLQFEFSAALARLIQQANILGYGVTMGECYRTPEQAALNAQSGSGIAHSLHTDRLAVDIQLFKDGQYLSSSEDYAALGAWWKSGGAMYCWGGDFKRPDGNHFSLSPDGLRK